MDNLTFRTIASIDQVRCEVPEIHPRKVRIKGKAWTLATAKLKGCHGICDHPDTSHRHIWISTTTRGLELLDTLLHEMTHAAFPDLSEDAVLEFATDAANVLWGLGYRAEWDDENA